MHSKVTSRSAAGEDGSDGTEEKATQFRGRHFAERWAGVQQTRAPEVLGPPRLLSSLRMETGN